MAIERNPSIRSIQSRLVAAGFLDPNPGADGVWGPASEAAFNTLLVKAKSTIAIDYDIAWSAKVSPEFVAKVKDIVAALGMPSTGADDLMGCMAWESGMTFSPSQYNRAGSGAVGLIQFMPLTAVAFFYKASELDKMSKDEKLAKGKESCAKLAAMTAEQQLDYVHEYFKPYKGRLKNLGDLYMAILWPAGIGKDDEWALWDKATRPTTYRQNMGLDVDKNETITRGECVFKVREMLNRGFEIQNRRKLV